ncbi:MAG TPA: ATP-grasp domain-containing protein [Candidatus Paceibacterota bacterium]|nr:ATP-grasp domain-containing protein [Candidatus Paceibacterota bacterium]
MNKKLNILFIGYISEPFDYFDLDDKLLIDSMRNFRDDNISIVHWKDIKDDLSSNKVFDLNSNNYKNYDLNLFDVIPIIELPDDNSPNMDKERVFDLISLMNINNLPTINPTNVFLNNPDKSYLWTNKNIPLPKTFKVDSNSNIESILKQLGEEIIIKPTDGDGGRGVEKVINNLNYVKEIISEKGPMIVQEFVKDIYKGERSLFFFDKDLKYAILKKPKKNEFRSNEKHCQNISKYIPNENEIRIAKEALNNFNSGSLIERVDLAGEKIIELTVDCPGLYVNYANVEKEIGPWFYELINKTLESRNQP